MVDWLLTGWELGRMVSLFLLTIQVCILVDHASWWSLGEGEL